MASSFNAILAGYTNAALTTSATLAFASGSTEMRSGVIIANNSASGSGDLHVVLNNNFVSTPTMTNPTLKVSPGNSVQIACNIGVAIWLASSTSTIAVNVTPVQI